MKCNKDENNCLAPVLTVICLLQNNSESESICNCEKKEFECPELGKYNTRPVVIYNCYGNPWMMPIDTNDYNSSKKSFVFRIEKINDCCATFRVLNDIEDPTTKSKKFVATNNFFIIDLNCICAINCLEDTFIECI